MLPSLGNRKLSSFLLTLAITSIVHPAFLHVGQAEALTYEYSDGLLLDVLRAMEKATDFFGVDYSTVNIDGLFGIRLAQGNIIEASRFCHGRDAKCPNELTQRLRVINETIGALSDKALPYAREDDPEYFNRFSQTIDAPYLVPYKPESIAEYMTPVGHSAFYAEKDGDVCLSSMMGALFDEDTGSTVPKCTVQEGCWHLMTQPDQKKYAITHQLLFFIFGEKTGCLEQLDRELASRGLTAKTVKELEKVFCGQIVSEMREEAETGAVKTTDQDLFLEQSVLCGTLGYREVFPAEWIRMVLSWQNYRGCFSMPRPLIKVQSKLEQLFKDEQRLMDLLEEEAWRIDRATMPRRKLLRERILDDDCLSHKSGLGIGLLGAYLRYIIQVLYR